MIRYIADMHFDHADIIPYDNRPFDSVEDMNETLIENWNRVVGEQDLTWILGDFCAGDTVRWKEILSRLNGKKALILGNHDSAEAAKALSNCCKDALDMAETQRCQSEDACGEANAKRCYFEEAAEYREITDTGRHVVLCHYPIPAFHDQYFGWYHLYGHVHTSFDWNIMENAKRLMRNLYVRQDICRMANIGAMLPYMDYTPRTLDELLPQL